jgi:hypothetical protein
VGARKERVPNRAASRKKRVNVELVAPVSNVTIKRGVPGSLVGVLNV